MILVKIKVLVNHILLEIFSENLFSRKTYFYTVSFDTFKYDLILTFLELKD